MTRGTSLSVMHPERDGHKSVRKEKFMKDNKLYCLCGKVVGETVFSHIDPKMRGFGQNSDRVYKNVYNGKEARKPDGMIIPLKNNNYMCKDCYKGETK